MNPGNLLIAICLAGTCPCFSGPVAGGMLGRLFLTPEQRLSLEAHRFQQPAPDAPLKQNKTVSPAPLLSAFDSKAYTLNGLVMQGGNRYTIWLNGVPYTRANLPANINLSKTLSRGVVSVTVPENDRAYLLRPGQTLDATTGQVSETFGAYPRASTKNATIDPPEP